MTKKLGFVRVHYVTQVSPLGFVASIREITRTKYGWKLDWLCRTMSLQSFLAIVQLKVAAYNLVVMIKRIMYSKK